MRSYFRKALLSCVVIFFCSNSFGSEYAGSTYNACSPVHAEFADYMHNVKEKIQNNWRNPEIMEEGHVVLKFKLTRDGEIFAYDIQESSGNAVFDEYAIEALQKSAPFGEFPQTSNKDWITICYNFDSSIVKTDKIKELVANSEKFINIDNHMARNLLDEAIKEAQGDCVAYFLYARRSKIDRLLGDSESARKDMEECKVLKSMYDKRRIQTCKKAILAEDTPFAHFALANAYDLAGDYNNALVEIDKAISMTELNHAYKRYRDEISIKNIK